MQTKNSSHVSMTPWVIASRKAPFLREKWVISKIRRKFLSHTSGRVRSGLFSPLPRRAPHPPHRGGGG